MKRYATAQELADELGRFLNDESIQARPIRAPEKLWRWCRRRPAIATLGVATPILLLAVAIGAPIAAYRINQARKAKTTQRQRAEDEASARRGQLYAAEVNLAQ